MASDLKIEMFAYHLFHSIWHDKKIIKVVPDVFEIYSSECDLDDSYVQLCDGLFRAAMYCRSDLLHSVYREKFPMKGIRNLKSLSEISEYINRMCDRDDVFGHLSVFDKMLSTSDIVVKICYWIHEMTDGFVEALRYAHIIWAMYFDKFTAEFYEKGGWSKLKREAKCYKIICDFELIFKAYSPFFLTRLKEATVNYFRFKNGVNFQKRKHKVHVSKLWVQFQIEHISSYIQILKSYEISINVHKAEILIEDLKLIFDFTRGNPDNIQLSTDNIQLSTDKHQVSTFSAHMSYSEIPYASEEMKANPDDDTQIQNLSFKHESRIISKTPEEFSHIFMDLKGKSQSRSVTSAIEKSTFDVIEANENPELNKNTVIETEIPRKTSNTDSTNDFLIEQNLFPAVDTKKLCESIIKNFPSASDLDLSLSCRSEPYIDKNEDITNECFYESNVDTQADITNTDQVPTCHQIEKNEKDSSINDRAIPWYLDFANESINNDNEIEKSKDMLKMKSGSEEGYFKTAEPKDDSADSSVTKIVAPDKYGLSLDLGYSLKENVNSDDEREKIARAREDLRNEQKDPEVCNFLRMIMVLGDTEGTKCVLSMAQNSKEQSKNSQKSLNKRKKKKRK